MNKKLTARMLVLICLLTAAGCASSPAGKEEPTVSPETNDSAAEETVIEEKPDYFAELPEKDYEGRTFTMLCRDLYINDQWTDGINGNVFNDAVYERNAMVAEKYNVTLSALPIAGEWSDRAKFLKTVRSAVQAGDGAYDLIEGYAATIGDGFADHLYYNLNEVPGLQLDQLWWSALIRDELTVNGRLFAITGDIAVNLWKNMQVIYFHKGLLTEYDLESPYNLVLSGKWTLDKYLSMIKGIGKDLDGNGKMDKTDQYGALYWDTLSLDNIHNSFGVHLTKRDSDGNLTLDLFNDMTVFIARTAADMAFGNPDIYFAGGDESDRDPSIQNFTEGKALFYSSILEDAEIMRDMTMDFGILPPPKYNEEQKEYYTTPRGSQSMFVIPVDVKDLEFSGMITEALCVAGNQKVIPAYYDKVLKSKVARDEESGEMLDIIRDGLVPDFAMEYAVQTERAGFIIRDCVYYKTELPSTFEKNEEKWNTKFEKFLTPYYD